MYRVFISTRGIGDTVRCTWAISVRPVSALCTETVFAGVRGEDTPNGSEWWSGTTGIVVCGEGLACSDEYGGVALQYVVRGV